ncbi:MAG: type I pullulanase [Lachnospiraceae bacterium]|nr:type I pullulanase [Lachnospiraceae bacterium]
MKTQSSSTPNQPSKKSISDLTARYDSPEFEREFDYPGHDLGAVCTADGTEFRLWAPTAERVELRLFASPAASKAEKTVPLQKQEHGVWFWADSRNLHGIYYTWLVTIDGKTVETTDPYARACCANGVRSMVVDLPGTDPDGWSADHGPALAQPTDAVLYELHIRDISSDASSGILAKGKFAGLAESGTKNRAGLATGLDHIAELGVTHVHLLPSFDYASVDETADVPSFNWGYDPANYNIPEGSYSSDPQDGSVRIREFKELVQALHVRGLGVVMDVVYNHTSASADSCFNRTVPYYYYRMTPDGHFSNGSGCGNETASERPMVRRYLVDSVAYWAQEYHIDGFRFDLMGLHDLETMRAVRARLDEINPQLLMYGEGWTGGSSVLPENKRAVKSNMSRLPSIAAFNDNLRDALKGNVFSERDRGFVSGKKKLCGEICFGVAGCTAHPQLVFAGGRSADKAWTTTPAADRSQTAPTSANDAHTCAPSGDGAQVSQSAEAFFTVAEPVRSADRAWASSPAQCVNYVSAHDNLALWDKLAVSCRSCSRKLRVRMNLLAAAVCLTAQGIPFFQAGEEFLRSKPLPDGAGFSENSYNAPDSVNSLKWDELTKNRAVYEYYRGLIAFRKAHPALRLADARLVAKHLEFLSDVPENTVGFLLKDHAGGDSLREICVLYNPNRTPVQFSLPDGVWEVYAEDGTADANPLRRHTGWTIGVEPVSCTILGRR